MSYALPLQSVPDPLSLILLMPSFHSFRLDLVEAMCSTWYDTRYSFSQIDFLVLFDVCVLFSFVMQQVTFHVQITVFFFSKPNVILDCIWNIEKRNIHSERIVSGTQLMGFIRNHLQIYF